MNLKLIEARIAELKLKGKPIFAEVTSALDPSQIVEDGMVTRDCAFVVPMAESAESDERTTGAYSQQITVSFGVMIGIRSFNDRHGKNINERLHTIKTELRKALLGWEIDPAYNEIELVQGELVAFLKGGAFWMEQYRTSYLYEQESGQ